MQISPKHRIKSQRRTLESINVDLEIFRADGANIKRAKHYNNVIDNPAFNVPIDQVYI